MKNLYLSIIIFALSSSIAFAGPDSVETISGMATIDVAKIQENATNSGFTVQMIDNQLMLIPIATKIPPNSPELKSENLPTTSNSGIQNSGTGNMENRSISGLSSEISQKTEDVSYLFFYGIIFWNFFLTVGILIFFIKSRKVG